ncbi:transcriptional regulator [Salegentibacter salinarum]|uniref:Transcriptional regulator n=1 Tax=Salegentibacter salinarum TaxID=447422 RepID=A0A2N0U1E7_9FLAO|nr:winged helix-turn-helix transcriptional regulator [Salegentibacter salinarum]PKD20833.1 transcriptional regulator [Salegentibacter salinarum]SKB78310.1 transcriptional regulator, HxlR family [Salegentibacter salinarum]
MRKQSSTNTINKEHIESNCGIAYTNSVLNGRWKLNILAFLLDEEKLRYSELKTRLIGISERMLIAQLKELQADGLVHRNSYPEVPPRVEYSLTPKGKSLEKILIQMAEWGTKNNQN